MMEKLAKILIIVLIFALGSLAGFFFRQKIFSPDGQAAVPANPYTAFLDEVYVTIQDNYWQKLTDEELNRLFILGAEKLTGKAKKDKPENKAELLKLLEKDIKAYDEDEKKKQFATTLADLVLSNLEPAGRSRLYTQKDEKSLSDNVQNKNPEVDRYQVLGIDKEASEAAIKIAYQKESEKWNPETNQSPEAEEKFAQIEESYNILSDPASREIYQISGVEPTMDYKLIQPDIFYIHIKKFSPTTFDELKRVTDKPIADQPKPPDTLILDLRDNVGGAIDGLPYFLGPFIGADQYAYQFFHQGEKEDFKTITGWLPGLVPYKKVVILINQGSQSTAELMASTLKKYNVGVLVGSTTKGWGTIEKVIKIDRQIDPQEKYSVFLVHSLALGSDGQPIEGRGVQPLIDTNLPNWEEELYDYFNSQEIVTAVKEILNQ